MRRSSAVEEARSGALPPARRCRPARSGRGIGAALLAGIAAAVAAGGAVAEAVHASPWVALANARVRLLAGPAAEGYLGGVELVLADGWKTYWRMPGDAGVPPSFDWAGSGNIASLSVLYPAPRRFTDPAATTIGYSGSVVFPIAIAPLKPDSPVALSLDLAFGICRDICIPAETHLSLAVAPADVRGIPSARLRDWLDRVPRSEAQRREGDPEVTRATASLAGPDPHLLIEARFPRGDAGADLFLEAGAADDIYLPPTRRLPDGPGGTLRFTVDLARVGNARALSGKTLRLTLVSDHGASERAWTIP